MTTAITAPAGACDCHVHIYEDGYPLAPTATFKPPHAPLSAYRDMQEQLGLERVVLVQATGYGLDNRCTLAALAQLGAAARAIVIIDSETSDEELERLHALGVRGVRFMMIPNAGGPLPWDALEPMAARIAGLGWNINLQFDGRELPHYRALIERLPCKLVIDHTGKFLEPVPPQHRAFRALLAVLESPDRFVKLAAPYETSKIGPPGYDDVAALARALLQAHPDRCLWASNWPHPNRTPRPADADLLALLADWCGEATLFRRVLVDNPQRLYAF
jgi:D-galactarolactone isomerase